MDAVARERVARCARRVSSWRIWCADRLIATRIAQALVAPTRLCRQASSMTQLPIASIRPKRSAIGMKTLGRIMPRVGCFQRSSASTPVTLPLFTSIFGW